MGRRHIAPEDIDAQLSSMTELMTEVLETIDAGTANHGRAIARILEVPFPQVYYVLNVMTGRRFLSADWDDDIPTRKNHALTPVGRELLARVRQPGYSVMSRQRRTPRISPDEYARRMRVSGVLSWMIRQGLVSTRLDLEHIMKCPDCERLLQVTEDGWASQVRCDAHPRNAVISTGE